MLLYPCRKDRVAAPSTPSPDTPSSPRLAVQLAAGSALLAGMSGTSRDVSATSRPQPLVPSSRSSFVRHSMVFRPSSSASRAFSCTVVCRLDRALFHRRFCEKRDFMKYLKQGKVFVK